MVNQLSRIDNSGAMKPTISKTKCWKWAKSCWKSISFGNLTTGNCKPNILFYADTVCLTNRSWFISQPLEQNSTLQAEFPPQFLKLTKHKSCSKNISLGIHAWDEEYIGNGDEGGQNLSHFGSRGWFHFWKTYEPAMGMWSVPFCFSISTNNFISGMDSKGDSCCSMTCYWLISEIGKFFTSCNGNFCFSGWLMNCPSDRQCLYEKKDV